MKAKINLLENSAEKQFSNGEYTITYTPRAEIEISARAVYIQYYNNYLSSFDYYSHPLYDSIAPLDLSIFIGSTAEYWKDYKVKHEKRFLWVSARSTADGWKNAPLGEWENLHIIPLNKNIFKGFKTIHPGDIIRIKGQLIDWQGEYNNKAIKMETALDFTTVSKERDAGQLTWLCMQVLVTELYANGYIFR